MFAKYWAKKTPIVKNDPVRNIDTLERLIFSWNDALEAFEKKYDDAYAIPFRSKGILQDKFDHLDWFSINCMNDDEDFYWMMDNDFDRFHALDNEKWEIFSKMKTLWHNSLPWNEERKQRKLRAKQVAKSLTNEPAKDDSKESSCIFVNYSKTEDDLTEAKVDTS